jgi:hypothetical protein
MTDINQPDQPASEAFLYIVCVVDETGKHSAPVKIGVTINCATRLAGLQSGNPHKLDFYATFPFASEADAYRAERQLHELLVEHRLSGEWFNLSPELVIPRLILASQCEQQRAYSWIKMCEVEAAVIEKFIASHKKNGWKLYRRFRAQALAEVAGRPPMSTFKAYHKQVASELQGLIEDEADDCPAIDEDSLRASFIENREAADGQACLNQLYDFILDHPQEDKRYSVRQVLAAQGADGGGQAVLEALGLRLMADALGQRQLFVPNAYLQLNRVFAGTVWGNGS